MPRGLRFGFINRWLSFWHGRPIAAKDVPMSVSAIAVSAPVTAPAPTPASAPDTSAAKTPDQQNDNDASDATEAPPPVVAALPPGQGTRIDQIA
jgi:hypothetical protein